MIYLVDMGDEWEEMTPEEIKRFFSESDLNKEYEEDFEAWLFDAIKRYGQVKMLKRTCLDSEGR